MATVTKENIAPLNDKLVVTLTKEDYLPAFEKSLKNYSKQASLPGFRKGMVPKGLIKKMHGLDILTEEIFRAVDTQINKYLTDNKINVLVQPIPFQDENLSQQLDINADKDYTFAFELGLQPEVKVDPKDIKATRYNVEVTDAMVDEEVNKLELRHGKYSDPEAISEDDDVLNIELTELDAEGNAVENGLKLPTSILYKNLSAAGKKSVNGKKAEDVVKIQLDKAFLKKDLQNVLAQLGKDIDDKETAAKSFELKIVKVGHIERPELNEEFFKKVYPAKEDIKTVEDFKKAIKEELENYFKMQASGQIHDQIYHYLTEDVKLELPADYLKRWMKVQSQNQKSDEQIEKELPDFEKQLTWNIISNQLCEANEVKVEKEDLKDFARQQIMGYLQGQIDVNGDTSWLEDYANKMIQDQKFVEQSYGQVMAAKLFEKLEDKVSATDEKISEEDFAKKLQEHNHAH